MVRKNRNYGAPADMRDVIRRTRRYHSTGKTTLYNTELKCFDLVVQCDGVKTGHWTTDLALARFIVNLVMEDEMNIDEDYGHEEDTNLSNIRERIQDEVIRLKLRPETEAAVCGIVARIFNEEIEDE